MSLVVDTPVEFAGFAATSFVHRTMTVPSGTELLVALVDEASGSHFAVSGITWNSVALTRWHRGSDTVNQAWAEIWYLVNPTPGVAGDIDFTFEGNVAGQCGAITVSGGVDTATPFRNAGQTATGSGPTQPTITVNSATGDIAISCVCDNENAVDTLAEANGQTIIYNNDGDSGNVAGAGGYKAGATTVVMGYTGLTAAAPWVMVGASIQPTGGGGGGGSAQAGWPFASNEEAPTKAPMLGGIF